MCEETVPVDETQDVDNTEALMMNTLAIHNLRYDMCKLLNVLERIAHRLER